MGKVLLWISLGIALVAVAVWWFAIRRPRIPDRVEKMGPLDLVTHTSWTMDGWNNGRLSWGTVESYSVQYHGKPFSFEGQEQQNGQKVAYTRCNAFFTFPSAEPAVVVNVGDPVNTSYFYLLREGPQGLKSDFLADTRTGPSAYMLDGPRQEASSQADQSSPNRHFTGGHFLLLGTYGVLDTETAHWYPIERLDGVDPRTGPLSVSPDGHSFVRTGIATSPGGPVEDLLLDTQFVTGHVAKVPIDRTRMRYNERQEIDEAWVDRHFEWKQEPDGHFQLTERSQFTPLPFHVERKLDSGQFDLVNVKPEMFERVVEFLSKEYPGARQPVSASPADAAPRAEFQIEGVVINVVFRNGDVGVWCNTSKRSPVLNQVADRIDAFLKTGAWDGLFLPNS